MLAQTERNLRALEFFQSARVVAGPPHDGVVDVVVTTQDAWTTEIGLNFGRGGGKVRWAAGLTESNFLGLGKQIGFSYDDDVERTNRSIVYQDPALLGPYWSGALLYEENSDGRRRSVRVSKPFVSTTDRLAADGLWDRHELEERLYSDGEVSSEYAQRHQRIFASWGTAIAAGPVSTDRVRLSLDFFQDDFTNLAERPADALPANRDFRYFLVGWEHLSNDFVSTDYVDRAERVEDFNLGLRLSAEGGVSPKGFGAAETTFAAGGRASRGWRVGPAAFLLADASFRTRLDGGIQNAILSGTVTFVWKHEGGRPLQTTVAHVAIDRGWNLDKDVQFFADGDHGLRGYRLYAFEGDRRVVLNVEQRFFGGFQVLQLFSVGAAVFVDSGTAVPPGLPLNWKAIHTDAGAGLRIGIARAASNTVLRLDCAYAFDPDPLGRRGWLLSFSSGQGF